MTDKEFLEKYGNDKVYFSSTYKHGVTYRNRDLGIIVCGIIDYKDYMEYEETVNEIASLEDFYFMIEKQ